MSRITIVDLQDTLDRINDKLKRMGSDVNYGVERRNDAYAVDVYRSGRCLHVIASGTAKECIGKVYEHAFGYLHEAACDRLREAAAEFTSAAPKELRIKITDNYRNVSFLTRDTSGRVSLQTNGGVPLSLSNIASRNATELSFAIKDAKTLDEAVKLTRGHCYGHLTVEGIKG